MISRDEISPVGSVNKTHGIKGELSVSMDPGVDPATCRCLIVEIDGIFVPMFLDGCRSRGTSDTYLIHLDGYDSDTSVKQFVGKELFVMNDDLPDDLSDDEFPDDEERFYLEDLVGFSIFDGENLIGEIIDIDDSTSNILFVVNRPDGSEALIPAADDLIEKIDIENKILLMEIPLGLLD